MMQAVQWRAVAWNRLCWEPRYASITTRGRTEAVVSALSWRKRPSRFWDRWQTQSWTCTAKISHSTSEIQQRCWPKRSSWNPRVSKPDFQLFLELKSNYSCLSRVFDESPSSCFKWSEKPQPKHYPHILYMQWNTVQFYWAFCGLFVGKLLLMKSKTRTLLFRAICK